MAFLFWRAHEANGRKQRPCVQALEGRVLLSAGDLDPTFGTGGSRLVGDVASGEDMASALAVLPDNRLLVGGSSAGSSGGDTVGTLTRYTPDGQLDATFASGGMKRLANLHGAVDHLLLEPDGSLIATGSDASSGDTVVIQKFTTSGTMDPTWIGPGSSLGAGSVDALLALAGGKTLLIIDHTLAVLNADGTADTGFGSGGTVTIPADPSGLIFGSTAAALQSDGRIIIAGYQEDLTTGSNWAEVRRYLPNGQLDTTFATGGKLLLSGVSSIDSRLSSVVVRSGDSIVVTGYSRGSDGLQHSIVAQLTPGGSMDSNFGTHGVTTIIPVAGSADRLESVVLEPDGSVLAGGLIDGGTSSPPPPLFISRLTADGHLDPSFDGTGILSYLPPGPGHIFGPADIGLQQSGQIVLSTSGQTSYNVPDDLLLTRFNPDGSADSSFGGSGLVKTDYPAPQDILAGSGAQQPDGKIVLTGSSAPTASDFIVARLNSDGTSDSSFGNGGVVNVDLGARDSAFATAVQSDGKLVVVGRSESLIALKWYYTYDIIRLNPDGTLDGSFGNGGKVITNLNASAFQSFFNVAIQSDGDILAQGFYQVPGQVGPIFIRYHSDGTIDQSFGTGGDLILSIRGAPYPKLSAFWLTSDGHIMVEGTDTPSSGALDRYVARLNRDGSFDSSFGNSGVVLLPGTTTDLITTVRFVPGASGDIYLPAVTTNYSTGISKLLLTKFAPDGSLDSAFGNGGTASAPLTPDISNPTISDQPTEVRQTPDGQFLVVGKQVITGLRSSTSKMLVMRLAADGTPDQNFSITGTDEGFDPGGGGNSVAEDGFVTADGRIVVAGQSATTGQVNDWAVMRLLGATAPPAFSISGTVFYDANNNGVQDGTEKGQGYVTVYLDANGNGKLDIGERSTISDTGGHYLFRDLPPGQYQVREVVPTDEAQTAPLSYFSAVPITDADATGPTFANAPLFSVPMNFNYLVALARGYGHSGTFANGDLNGDGKVDFSDLVILARNYGRTLTAWPVTSGAAAVLAPAMLTPSLDPQHWLNGLLSRTRRPRLGAQ